MRNNSINTRWKYKEVGCNNCGSNEGPECGNNAGRNLGCPENSEYDEDDPQDCLDDYCCECKGCEYTTVVIIVYCDMDNCRIPEPMEFENVMEDYLDGQRGNAWFWRPPNDDLEGMIKREIEKMHHNGNYLCSGCRQGFGLNPW